MTDLSHELIDKLLTRGASSETIFLLLSSLKEQGDNDRVIQECLRALKSYPDDIRIRQLLAGAYWDKDMVSQADQEISKVIEMMEGIIPVYKLHAHILKKQGRNLEAIDALNIFLAAKPQDSEALGMLEELGLEKDQPAVSDDDMEEEAAPTEEPVGVEQAEKKNADSFSDILTPTLAEVYFDQGQTEKAIEIYEKLVEKNPEDNKSRERLGELKSSIESQPPGLPEKDALTHDVEMESKGELEIKKDPQRENKEKMISVLESWLENIRTLPKSVPT